MSRRAKPKSEAPWHLNDFAPGAGKRIREWAAGEWPEEWQSFLTATWLRAEWGKCRDWHRAHGEWRSDWEASFRNWLLKARPPEARRQPRSRRAEPERLDAPLLRLIRGG